MPDLFVAPDAHGTDCLWENHGRYRDATVVIRRTELPSGPHEDLLWQTLVDGLTGTYRLVPTVAAIPPQSFAEHTADALALIHDAVGGADDE